MNIMIEVLRPEFVNDSLTPPQADKPGPAEAGLVEDMFIVAGRLRSSMIQRLRINRNSL